MAYKPNMYCTLLSTQAHCCQQSNAYFEGISMERVPCRFCSLALGCCPSTVLQSEHEQCVCCVSQKIFSEIFLQMRKICKIRDPLRFSAYSIFFCVQSIDSGLPLQIDESADVYGFIAENLGATWQ